MFPQMLTVYSGEDKANPISSLVKYMVHYCYLEFLYCGTAWRTSFSCPALIKYLQIRFSFPTLP